MTTSQQQTQDSGDSNFCKDCGVMFESSKSLEVHLSYHKENLLTRWANPAPPSSSETTVIDNSSSSGDRVSSKNQSPSRMEIPTFQYSTSQYNNNTGDHHIVEPPQTTSANHTFLLNQQQSEFGGRGPVANELFVTATTSNSTQSFPSQLFSSYQHGSGNIAPPNSLIITGGKNEQQRSGGGDTPAEILDLDSHKVHIYQHQQQAAAEAAARNNFYRPYLPAHLHSSTGNHVPHNGWPDQFTPSSSFPPPSEHRPLPNGYGSQSASSFEHLIRINDVGSGSGGFQQSSYIPPTTTTSNNNNTSSTNNFQSGFPTNSNGHGERDASPPMISEISHTPPAESGLSSTTTTTPVGRGKGVKGAKSAKVANTSSSDTPGSGPSNGTVKNTKGWKGGECKRPKSYNCTACSKWFTSSGHLKRHYGTTLHKNSVKQKGEDPADTPPVKKSGPGQKKGSVTAAVKAKILKNAPSTESSTSESSPQLIRATPPKVIEDAQQQQQQIMTSGSKLSPSHSYQHLNGIGGRSIAYSPPNTIIDSAPFTTSSAPYFSVMPSYNTTSMHSHQQYQFHHPSMTGHPIAYSNGFPSDHSGLSNGGFGLSSPIVATTSIYNSGYPPVVESTGAPLPPFSFSF